METPPLTDAKREREHLAQANRHIAQAHQFIAQQKQLIEKLERGGGDIERADEEMAMSMLTCLGEVPPRFRAASRVDYEVLAGWKMTSRTRRRR